MREREREKTAQNLLHYCRTEKEGHRTLPGSCLSRRESDRLLYTPCMPTMPDAPMPTAPLFLCKGTAVSVNMLAEMKISTEELACEG